jgi:hypothetical protein
MGERKWRPCESPLSAPHYPGLPARPTLNDPAAEAVVVGQHMANARLAKVRAIGDVYTVDLARFPLTLRKVPAALE